MEYATEGHKCLPFSDKFRTLGLEIDSSGFAGGRVLVGHTENRREELHGQLDAFLRDNAMSAKDAERLRGRMIFFEGYTFGRVANAAVKALGRLCTGPRAARTLDTSSRSALQFLKQRVLDGPPLTIERALHSTWFIFTDGACDQVAKTGSIGGVLYSPSGECLRFFGESVRAKLLDDLFSRSKNPIHELEVLPILVAASLWGDLFPHSQVVYFIDNESSRMACIRGTGETLRASEVIQAFVNLESKLQHKVWFGRVPSHSNPADSPSRLHFEEVVALGAVRTSVDWETTWKHLSL